jgi:hypothetical protein
MCGVFGVLEAEVQFERGIERNEAFFLDFKIFEELPPHHRAVILVTE